MSRGIYIHTHRMSPHVAAGRSIVHDPDGTLRGYVQRGQVMGYGPTVYVPLDERGQKLAGAQDSHRRAIEFVVER